MLSLASNRIYLYSQSVNMQKGFESLSGLVEQAFPNQLFTGSLFVFMNRKRNKLKVLYFDIDGMAIWYKRLERGCFNITFAGESEISRMEFLMLLEGVTPHKINRRFKLLNK